MSEADTQNTEEQEKAIVEVFTSPTCPHCPPAKKLVETLAEERSDIIFKERSTASPEGSKRAREFEIMSVPTIIVTGPRSQQPIGLKGLPPKKGLEKAINISLGKDKFKGDKNQGDDSKKKSFIKRLFS